MAFFYDQLKAKEEFKKLIVHTIEDAKNFFNNLEFSKFIGAVTMLDCLIESYKEDPEFIASAQVLNQNNNISANQLSIMEIQGIEVSRNEQQRGYFIEWFRLLVKLATRTVFAGRLTDVDIDLGSVMKLWRDMTEIDTQELQNSVLDKTKTDTEDEDLSEGVPINDGITEE